MTSRTDQEPMTFATSIRSVEHMLATQNVLQIDGLAKRYGTRTVVDDVALSVRRGEVFGIVGPNGAGKTTIIECAQGLTVSDAGSVRVLGLDPRTQRRHLADRIGSQLQQSALPDRLRVGEALGLFGTGRSPSELSETWALKPLWRRPLGTLSGGQRQRVFVALALLNDPEIVFLDEVTQGLDPTARRDIWRLLADIAHRGTTVVLVTHFAEEAETLCDRIAVVQGGRIVAMGTPRDIIDRQCGGITASFGDRCADPIALRAIPGVTAVALAGARVEVVGRRPMIAHLGSYLVERAARGLAPIPDDLRVSEPTLDDALARLLAPETASERMVPA